MKKIKKLVHQIKDEIKDADQYYICGLMSQSPKEKEVYASLANQELDHANKLHDLIVIIINDYKSAGNTPPEGMLSLWEYEHEEMIKDVNELKEKIYKM